MLALLAVVVCCLVLSCVVCCLLVLLSCKSCLLFAVCGCGYHRYAFLPKGLVGEDNAEVSTNEKLMYIAVIMRMAPALNERRLAAC